MVEITYLLGHCRQLPHTDLEPIGDEAGDGIALLERQTPCLGTGRRMRVHQRGERLQTLQTTPRGGMRIDPGVTRTIQRSGEEVAM